jgi:hypothetical protein
MHDARRKTFCSCTAPALVLAVVSESDCPSMHAGGGNKRMKAGVRVYEPEMVVIGWADNLRPVPAACDTQRMRGPLLRRRQDTHRWARGKWGAP